ncbi:MAG: hypothetical protein ACKOEI_12960, partial [Chthoniobacterales bacterium]
MRTAETLACYARLPLPDILHFAFFVLHSSNRGIAVQEGHSALQKHGLRDRLAVADDFHSLRAGNNAACPPLGDDITDTIGAGDAFFSVMALAARNALPVDLTTFLGQLAGAQA